MRRKAGGKTEKGVGSSGGGRERARGRDVDRIARSLRPSAPNLIRHIAHGRSADLSRHGNPHNCALHTLRCLHHALRPKSQNMSEVKFSLTQIPRQKHREFQSRIYSQRNTISNINNVQH